MKNTIKFIAVSALLFFSANSKAEYLILNDGTVIKGKIDSSDQTSVVILKDGAVEEQTVDAISISKRISKPLHIEKLKIYKTDNTSVEAYCVDYDQTFYTFRKELNRTDEIKIPVKDILYFDSKLAPLNISAGQAKGAIHLKWTSSGAETKSFRIYYKRKSDASYISAGETAKEEFVIQGIESGTEYELLVRSSTSENFESFPGKAILLATVNQPPDKPGAVSRKDTGNSNAIVLTWGKSADSDGSVKGYNIYRKSGKDYDKAGSSENTEYSYGIKNPVPGQSFMIRAFDDKNLESEGAESENFFVKYYEVRADLGYLTASGDLADLFDTGICGLLTFSLNNYYLYGLSLGFQTGYYAFSSGKEFEHFSYRSFYAVPLLANAGYRYSITDYIYLEPSIGLGYCYAGIEYKDELDRSVSSTEFTPMVKAGISASWILNNINIGIGVYYSDIIESDAQLASIMIGLGAGYMF